MKRGSRLYWTFRKYRGKYRRLKRLVFASPAEMQLITLMGGKVVSTNLVHNRNGFPFTIVVSMGGWFGGKQHVKREVREGKFFVDFGNDIKRGIEIDSREWHMDITKDQERDEYFKAHGWRILRIKTSDLATRQDMIQKAVIDHLLN